MIPTIIGAGVVALVVGFIVVRGIINKKNGKSGCSCGCAGCANREFCHPTKEDGEK